MNYFEGGIFPRWVEHTVSISATVVLTYLCVIPQGTMGDALSNQHLLPLTTRVDQWMICHVVTHCAMMCGFDKREE